MVIGYPKSKLLLEKKANNATVYALPSHSSVMMEFNQILLFVETAKHKVNWHK